MTELDALLDDAAGEPSRPLDIDGVHRRSRALRRAHLAVVVTLLILATAAGAILFATVDTDDGATASFEVPEAETTVGELMPDETPIWIVRDGDGEIHVLEVVEPDLDRDPGPGDSWASNWCPDGRYFESPWGARFELDGEYLGGPARDGLTPREFEIDEETDRIVVGDSADEPMGRSDDVGEQRWRETCDGTDLVPHPEYGQVWGIAVG